MGTLVLFEEKQVRRIWHEEAWWFSVVDVVGALTDSKNARRYRSDLKRQLAEKEGFNELYEEIVQLKLVAIWRESFNKRKLQGIAGSFAQEN